MVKSLSVAESGFQSSFEKKNLPAMGSPNARDMHFDRVMRNLFAMKCPKVT